MSSPRSGRRPPGGARAPPPREATEQDSDDPFHHDTTAGRRPGSEQDHAGHRARLDPHQGRPHRPVPCRRRLRLPRVGQRPGRRRVDLRHRRRRRGAAGRLRRARLRPAGPVLHRADHGRGHRHLRDDARLHPPGCRRRAADRLPHLAQHLHPGVLGGPVGAVRAQHPPALVGGPSPPRHRPRRGARGAHRPHHNSGGLRPPPSDGSPRSGRGGGLGRLPHRDGRPLLRRRDGRRLRRSGGCAMVPDRRPAANRRRRSGRRHADRRRRGAARPHRARPPSRRAPAPSP